VYEPGAEVAAAPPPDSGKTIIFRIIAKFSVRRLQPKMKRISGVFIIQKTEFILSSGIKCPKSGIFTNN